MRGAFYISKISVLCDDKKTSDVVFKDGCNIICGPSNTGKSFIIACIDFGLGSKDLYYKGIKDFNITSVFIELSCVEGNHITIRRNVEKKTKIVVKDSNEAEEKHFTLEQYKEYLLKLIGIEGKHKIIKSKDYEPQSLTFRTMITPSIIFEDRIIGKESIFQQKSVTLLTPLLSSLLFLNPQSSKCVT